MSEPFRTGLDFLAGVDALRSIAAEDSLRTGVGGFVEVFLTGVLTFSPAEGRTAVTTDAATAAAVSMGSSTVGTSFSSTGSASLTASGSVRVWRAGRFGFWISSSQSGKYFDLRSLVCCNSIKTTSQFCFNFKCS